mgnify:CR=1 FL=1
MEEAPRRFFFRVRELAQARGWTAEELARQSKLKLSTVRNLWQGRTEDPSYSTVRAIAQALGVRIEELEAGVKETEQSQGNSRPLLLAA